MTLRFTNKVIILVCTQRFMMIVGYQGIKKLQFLVKNLAITNAVKLLPM